LSKILDWEDKVKLNLGSNNKHLEGFINVDLLPGPGVDIVCPAQDLSTIGDCSVDEILAEHLFEHFTFYQANRALSEWFRVLKDGGSLIIEVPDLLGLCKAFVEANSYQRFQSNKGHWGIIHHIYGNQRGRTEEECLSQTHKSGYTEERLIEMLNGVGFTSIIKLEPVKDTPGSSVIRIKAVK